MRQLPRTARLMVLPAALFLLVLVGMAISASPDPEFNPPTNSGPTNQSQSDFDPSGTRSGGDSDGESEPPSITIESDQGTIEVRFDSDGVARLSTDDGETELDLVSRKPTPVFDLVKTVGSNRCHPPSLRTATSA